MHHRMIEIFTPYVHRGGKIIYPKNGKYLHFWIKVKNTK